jgi:hypothetical protein
LRQRTQQRDGDLLTGAAVPGTGIPAALRHQIELADRPVDEALRQERVRVRPQQRIVICLRTAQRDRPPAHQSGTDRGVVGVAPPVGQPRVALDRQERKFVGRCHAGVDPAIFGPKR